MNFVTKISNAINIICHSIVDIGSYRFDEPANLSVNRANNYDTGFCHGTKYPAIVLSPNIETKISCKGAFLKVDLSAIMPIFTEMKGGTCDKRTLPERIDALTDLLTKIYGALVCAGMISGDASFTTKIFSYKIDVDVVDVTASFTVFLKGSGCCVCAPELEAIAAQIKSSGTVDEERLLNFVR